MNNIDKYINSQSNIIINNDDNIDSGNIKSKLKEKISLRYSIPVNNIKVVNKKFNGKTSKNNVSLKKNNISIDTDINKLYYSYWEENNFASNIDTEFFFNLDEQVKISLPSEIKLNKGNTNINLMNIYYNNIYSYGEGYFSFEEKEGLLLIDGENEKGKSNLIRLFNFALYGAKSNKLNNIFNYFVEDKNAYTTLKLSIDNIQYLIIRKLNKKRVNIEQKFFMYQIHENGNLFYDLDKHEVYNAKNYNPSKNGIWCTNNDVDGKILTEDVLFEKIGGYKNYMFSNMFDSSNLLKWLNIKPTLRKRMLYDTYGLSIFNEKYEIAKKIYNKFKNEYGIKKDKDELENEIKCYKEEILLYTEQTELHTDEINDLKKKIKSKQEEINELYKKITTVNPELIDINYDNLINEYTKNNNNIDILKINNYDKNEHQEFLEKKQQLEQQLNSLQIDLSLLKINDSEIIKLQNQKNLLLNEYKTIKKINDDIDLQINEFNKNQIYCKKCNEPFNDETILINFNRTLENNKIKLSEIISDGKLIAKEIEKLNDIELNVYNNKKIEIEESIFNVNNIINNTNKKITEFEKSKELLNEYNILKEKNVNLKNLIDDYEKNEFFIKENKNLENSINSIKTDIDKLEINLKQYQNMFTDVSNKIHLLENNIKKCKEEITKNSDFYIKDEQYKIYLDCHNKNGISLNLMEKQIPIINDKLKELNEIYNFNFLVQIKKDNKDSENIRFLIIKNNIEYNLEQGSGYQKFIGSLLLHLLTTLYSDYQNNFSLINLDEIFYSIENNKLSKVVEFINDYYTKFFKNIFLITHRTELKKIIDNKIIIKNTNNISYI